MRQTLAPLYFAIFASFFTQTSSAADQFLIDFQEGVQAFQKQEYKKAAESFTKVLTQSPNNASALTNLALTESQLGLKGIAIGHFRRALSVEPGLQAATLGLKQTIAQLAVKEVPHRLETYEAVRTNFLEPVGLLAYLLLTAFAILSSGWLLLSYFGQRKRALFEQVAGPTTPAIGIFLGFMSLILVVLTSMKVWDSTQQRATFVQNKVQVQSAPGENQAALFEMYEGLEVIVRQSREGWAQISYPGGLSGWVPMTSLLVTTQ